MADITAEQVDAAAADLQKAKKGKDPAKLTEAMQNLADIRSAFREQEVAAGRRSAGLVQVEE